MLNKLIEKGIDLYIEKVKDGYMDKIYRIIIDETTPYFMDNEKYRLEYNKNLITIKPKMGYRMSDIIFMENPLYTDNINDGELSNKYLTNLVEKYPLVIFLYKERPLEMCMIGYSSIIHKNRLMEKFCI